MIPNIIKWLDERDKAGDKVFIAEAPFLFQRLLDELEQQGKTYDFGEKGAVITGGGWKTHEEDKIPMDMFRANIENVCPEGHYLHLPPTIVYPMVLDEHLKPVGYEESGRFAFIDPLANSYPGCIITGDIVKLYESCPVCGRTGPVLEPEVRRATGEEIRGCAEEMRRLMDNDSPELIHDLICAPDRSRMPLILLERED